MSLTNQDISQPSLCHLSLGSSTVRASHRRSEGCGFDSRLGLRNMLLYIRQSEGYEFDSNQLGLRCFQVKLDMYMRTHNYNK